jgi:hypothetical protein
MPSNDSPPSKPEVVFTIDDMAKSEFSEDIIDAQTFTTSIPLQSDD